MDDLIAQYLDPQTTAFLRDALVTNAAKPIGLDLAEQRRHPHRAADQRSYSDRFLGLQSRQRKPERTIRRTAQHEFLPVDVSNWRLIGGIEFTMRPGTVIPAGKSLYLAANVNAFRARAASPHAGQNLFVQGAFGGLLSTQGNTPLILENDKGVLVSQNSYAGNSSSSAFIAEISRCCASAMARNRWPARQFRFH